MDQTLSFSRRSIEVTHNFKAQKRKISISYILRKILANGCSSGPDRIIDKLLGYKEEVIAANLAKLSERHLKAKSSF